MCNCGYKKGDRVKYKDISGEITAKKDLGNSCDLDIQFERDGIESEITLSCSQVSPAG